MSFDVSAALDEVLSRLSVSAVSVLLLDHDSRRLKYRAGAGFLTDGIKTSNLGLGEGLPRIAALTKKRYTERHFADLLPSIPRAEALKPEGFVVYHASPLLAGGTLIGVLEIFERTPTAHDPQWFRLLEELTERIADGLAAPEDQA